MDASLVEVVDAAGAFEDVVSAEANYITPLPPMSRSRSKIYRYHGNKNPLRSRSPVRYNSHRTSLASSPGTTSNLGDPPKKIIKLI